MSDDILSQAEVESLLKASEAEHVQRAAGLPETTPAEGSAASSSLRSLASSEDRPRRASKTQLRALQQLHVGFTQRFAAALSELLQARLEVTLNSVEQRTYGEFVFSLDNLTCFNLIGAQPLEGDLVLDISPAILFPIIDRLLGGGANASPPARRPLTEIELLLASRITTLFNNELRQAWATVAEFDLAVERVECQPQLAQISPPHDPVVVVTFEVTLGAMRGMFRLCLPEDAVHCLGEARMGDHWDQDTHASATPESGDRGPGQGDGSRVQVVVTLAESTVSTADLIGLRVGDVITTEKNVRSPLRVDIAGVERFGASPGSFKGKTAIQVMDAIELRRRAS